MEATIEVNGLRKRFGPTVALDGMTFTAHPAQITGFVGPNGAGKSTTMRVILGLDAADEGTALIGGQQYASLRHPLNHVGSLIDAAALQPSRSARNHLLWLAHSQGLTAHRVDTVIKEAGLDKAARRNAGGYSLGMRQRLGIAAAMLGDPPVLMFDEPFNGMDPEGIIWMRGFLRSLAAGGRAVLVSSHLMSELEGTADHLVIAGRGQRPQEAAHPHDALGVHAVERLVHHQRRRVAEQRGGDAQPLPHAQREPARAPPGRLAQSGLLDHRVDPGGVQALGVRQPQQVVAGGAAGLQRAGVQEGADMAQRIPQACVTAAPDQGGALVGGVQAEDHPHRGGLAGPVGPDEPGHLPRRHSERHAVQRHRRAEALAEPGHFDCHVHVLVVGQRR